MMLKLSICLVFNSQVYYLKLNGTVFTSLKNVHGGREVGHHSSLV